MKIAYLVPTYPMPSQTFIRREIAALEAQGLTIERFAMRRFLREQTDPAERSEQEQTHYILDAGIVGLAWAVAAEAVSRPKRWIVAARAAVELGLRSERGLSSSIPQIWRWLTSWRSSRSSRASGEPITSDRGPGRRCSR